MHKLLCIILLMFSYGYTIGQSSNYGLLMDKAEIREQLSQAENDSTRAYLYNELAWAFHYNNIDSTQYYAEIALEIAKSIQYQSAVSRALNLLAIVDFFHNENELGRKRNLEALAIAESINDTFMICATLNDLAIDDELNGLPHEALKKYKKSLAYDSTVPFVAFTYLNISSLHLKLSNDSISRIYLEKAITNTSRVPHPFMQSITKLSLGHLYYERDMLDTALIYYTEAKEIAELNHDYYNLTYSLYNIAYLKQASKQFEIANEYYNQALDISEQHGFVLSHSYILTDYLSLLNERERYDEVVKIISQRLPGSFDGSPEEKLGRYEVLATAYEGKGEYLEALRYKDSIFVYHDSLLALDKQKVVTEIEAKYHFSEQEAKNKLLLAQQKEKELEISNKNLLISSLIVGILLFMILIGLISRLYWLKRQHNKELKKSVLEKTRELQLANEKLLDSNQELERFTHIASHDLKEPLRNIVSFAGLIERRFKHDLENNQVNEYFEHIKRSARQLYRLVEDVLEFSKIKTANDIPTKDTSLANIVKEIEYSLSGTLQERNAQILSSELPIIKTNEPQLFLILKNLIENGIKYNQSTAPIIDIRYDKSKEFHHIKVADNGIGIDHTHREQIFEMFHRLHDRTEYEGTGLGLAIVKKILTKMGGKIEVESKPTEGSTFTVSLPIIE